MAASSVGPGGGTGGGVSGRAAASAAKRVDGDRAPGPQTMTDSTLGHRRATASAVSRYGACVKIDRLSE